MQDATTLDPREGRTTNDRPPPHADPPRTLSILCIRGTVSLDNFQLCVPGLEDVERCWKVFERLFSDFYYVMRVSYNMEAVLGIGVLERKRFGG